MRSLFSNLGFAISAFMAVAVAAIFAFVLEATFEVVVSMLVVGVFTAIAEYVMRSRQQSP